MQGLWRCSLPSSEPAFSLNQHVWVQTWLRPENGPGVTGVTGVMGDTGALVYP